jgi:hypothetical protein
VGSSPIFGSLQFKSFTALIISKPQRSTITSFILFLTLTFIVLGMNVWIVVRDPQPAWYNYLIIFLLLPIALFVGYKIFIRYKIISLGNNLIEMRFPVLKKTTRYPLEQIEHWTENVVKTGKNSTYKELEIKFGDGQKLSMGHREFTEYEKVIKYLQQKVPKLKKATP